MLKNLINNKRFIFNDYKNKCFEVIIDMIKFFNIQTSNLINT